MVSGPLVASLRRGLAVAATLLAPAVVAADAPARPWLGVSINDASARWGGVAVLDVFEATPASLCGLRAGDEILAIGDDLVPGTEALRRSVQRRSVGQAVRVQFVRGDQLRSCRTRLAAQVTDPTELLQRRALDRPLPTLDVALRTGGVLDDAAARGATLVLALFSTACDGCAATVAAVAEQVVGDTGARLVAVTEDGDAPLAAWVQRHGVTVDTGVDRTTLVRRMLTDAQGVSVLVVDHEGVVRFAASGPGDDGAHLEAAAYCLRRAERARRRAE
jgi:hypothetical protein